MSVIVAGKWYSPCIRNFEDWCIRIQNIWGFNWLHRKSFHGKRTCQKCCIERQFLGKKCSWNCNESLKKKFFVANKSHSLIDLIRLLQQECATSSKNYATASDTNKNSEDKSRQSQFLMKECDAYIRNRLGVLPQEFLNKLTYIDNTGAACKLDNYEVGDKLEFDQDDDGAYEVLGNDVHEPQDDLDRNEHQQLQQSEQCIVCLSNPRSTMLEPCNHLRYCQAVLIYCYFLHSTSLESR